MRKVDSKHVAVFFAAFGTLALIINEVQTRTFRHNTSGGFAEPRRHQSPANVQIASATSESAKVVERNDEKDREALIARYLNQRPPRKSSVKTVAVVAVTEDGTFNTSLNEAIANRVSAGSVETLRSLFKPEFVSDGLFPQLFNGSKDILSKLRLSEVADVILLARQDVQYSENAFLQNVLTATMQLELMLLPLALPEQTKTWALTAVGPGFDKKTARFNAEERLLKQLRQDARLNQ